MPRAIPEGYTLVRCDPDDLSSEELGDAIDILRVGGAVDVVSARNGLSAAAALVFLNYRGVCVGLGTIKEKRTWYALNVQQRSGYTFDPAMRELGYVAVNSSHVGRRLSGHIVEALIAAYDDELFATTDNSRMKSTLRNRGFVCQGREWEGARGRLSLWLRIPKH